MSQLEDDVRERHPSYGMARFSRFSSSGRKRVFGSSIDKHYSMISLAITRGTVEHRHNTDWYYGEQELIEVTLTAAQFAELLTTMNVGSGVPCTIEHLDGKRIEDPPLRESQPEIIRENFREESKIFANRVREHSKKIMTSLDKLSKKKQAEVQGYLDHIIMHIESNMPFALTSFEEATEKVLTSTKAEAEAFVTHAVQLAGLQTLGALPKGIEPKQIEDRYEQVCSNCSSSLNVTLGPDPFNEGMSGNDNPVYLCNNCRNDRAMAL